MFNKNLTDSIKLLELYFKNKASQGAVTVNNLDVLEAFKVVVKHLEDGEGKDV